MSCNSVVVPPRITTSSLPTALLMFAITASYDMSIDIANKTIAWLGMSSGLSCNVGTGRCLPATTST